VADLRPDPLGAPFTFTYDPGELDDCRLIGGAAAWLGLGGIIVPSQRVHGDNLAIFVENLAGDDRVEPGERFDYPPGPPPELELPRLTVSV
jgi:hypothetical protein